MKQILFTVVLFAITAIAEIVGCYLGCRLLFGLSIVVREKTALVSHPIGN